MFARLTFVLLLSAFAAQSQTVSNVSFAHDVAPLLAEKCVQCHGQASTMSDLDLRTPAGLAKGGQHGAVVVPGKAPESLLYRRLTGAIQPQMPFGGRLTDAQIATVKAWIEQGARWDPAVVTLQSTAPPQKQFTEAQRRYWAFQPVVKPALPDTGANPVDALIVAKLAENQLKHNPRADKITLIRRATLDLTGLPPTTDEVQSFLADDSPDAFAKVVDRLLASPRYGERWGRHWLDVARYADSNGFKSDETRPNIWRYRDYVIRSFNSDKPYDRFIREQIAGDELYPADLDARIAVGFNRHYTDETNQPVLELRRQELLNNITDTVGAVFMGMTYGCARCHDHKFDPILHKDYYSLQAFFANVRAEDNLVLLSGEQLEAYKKQQAEWEAKAKPIRGEMDALVALYNQQRVDSYMERFSTGTRNALRTPPDQRTPAQELLAFQAYPQITYKDEEFLKELKPEQRKRFKELADELKQLDAVKPNPPVAQTIVDNGREAPPTHVLAGGSWDVPKEEVQPGFLTIVDPTSPKITPPEGLNSTGRRSALANWLADAKNPLTARVMVNRIWAYHFGTGIVATPSDFGVMGERPSHPKLLDYLASAFVESGWSVKKMHRLIMLSDVYQQSSDARQQALNVDPEDKLLWRYPRHRLEGEAIRDAMLAVSGNLNLQMGGPGVHPELPPGTLATAGKWPADKDPNDANRRSVYIFSKRVMTYPMFEAFDAPNSEESCPRRFRTVIPSQALTLMNDSLVLKWSQSLAGRVLNDGGLTTDQQIDRAYRLVLSRAPKPEEKQAILDFLAGQSELLEHRTEKPDAARVAAFVDFCHTLLNSNEFLYVN
jgi:mono/diheme cytochrome c family protein